MDRSNQVTSRIHDALQAAWTWLMPPRCCLCGANGHGDLDLCVDCLAALPALGQQCQICAVALVRDDLCGRCQQQPPAFDQVIAGFPYAQPIDYFVTQLKFARQPAYGRLLGQLVAPRLQGLPEPPQCLLPVPLHPRRQARRGFNQAHILAEELGRRGGIEVAFDALRKVRPTAPQMELDATRRRANLRRAFALAPRYRPPAHVALIDDVMTTGTTCDQLARLLKQNGAERVDVLVCARA